MLTNVSYCCSGEYETWRLIPLNKVRGTHPVTKNFAKQKRRTGVRVVITSLRYSFNFFFRFYLRCEDFPVF